MIRRPPRSPLFPSTTLSRSSRPAYANRHGIAPRLEVRVAGLTLQPDRVDPGWHGVGLDVRGDHGGPAQLRNEPVRGERRRSEEHTSELQSRQYLVCRLLLEK